MQYVFGAYTLDVHREELCTAGGVVRLDRQVFAVLTYLVQHRDRVVRRQELFEQLWSDRFVSDAALERCITVARRAVGDSGRTQQVIQTVRGRGYRFVAPVEERAGEASHREAWAAPDNTTGLHEELWPAGLDTQKAERRQLTILACQLVGVPEHAVPFDPEALVEALPDYHLMCAEVVRRFSGHIAQEQSEGLVVVYFGYPQAQEDDACRAVYAGLEIVEAMRQFQVHRVHERSARFAVRVGIHTGLVVMNAPGPRDARGPLALGQTQTIATQVQGLAPPDTVAISPATMRLVEGHVVSQALGRYLLDDATDPQVVFQILQKHPVPSRFAVVVAKGLTPFVSREAELALLRQRWAQVVDGLGQMIALSGEPGIGKSRLVQVLKDQVVQGPHVLWECYSSPHYQQTPLFPLIEFFPRAFQWLPEDSPAEKVVKLEQILRQYRLPLQETVPRFAALWSLPFPEPLYPPLALSPQRQRQKTLESIVALMLAQAEQHPVLFILEDLHWTDPTTLEFLNLLLDQTPTAALCVLLTCRPEFQPSWHHRSYLTEVTVNRLSRHQIARMAEQVTGEKGLPTEVVQQLVNKTDGVPLYVEEMTKTLLESGHLKEVDGHYELNGPMNSLHIPATLQDFLMARLDRLVTAKAVAQHASVIGRQFSYELLQAVSPLDETVLQHELRRLVEAELIYQRGLPPQAIYTFKHALIQDTAYQSLLRSTRQGYHRRIAEVLEEQFPETRETQPELLAQHYTEAGCNEQAVDYWYKAGEKAGERSAYAEAIVHLRKGLEVLRTLPDTTSRTQHELRLQLTLAASLVGIKGHTAAEVKQAYTRAHALCQQVGETDQLFTVLLGLRLYYFFRGPIQTARALGEDLLALALRDNDPARLHAAHWTLGQSLVLMGELASARPHLEQSMALFTPQPLSSRVSRDAAGVQIACLNAAAWMLWTLGYPDQALEKIHEKLALARELSHRFTLAFALCAAARLHILRGEMQTAAEQSEAATAISIEQGFALCQAQGVILRGITLVLQGQRQEGIFLIHQGQIVMQALGTVYRTHYLALFAEAYGKQGEVKEGLTVLDEALVIADKNGERGYEAELYRLQGDLLLQHATPDEERVETRFQQALNIARSQQAKSLELRTATSLARLWQSQGRRQDAYDLLAPVYEWFTEGFDTSDLQEAKALLKGLNGCASTKT